MNEIFTNCNTAAECVTQAARPRNKQTNSTVTKSYRTVQLIPWYRISLDKLIIAQPGKQVPTFMKSGSSSSYFQNPSMNSILK
jgi:hypothetical protein